MNLRRWVFYPQVRKDDRQRRYYAQYNQDLLDTHDSISHYVSQSEVYYT